MDLATYAIGGRTPARVEQPGTAEEVAAAIGDAHRSHKAVVVWGGGTRIGIGDAPTRYDAAVDLTRLRGMVELSPPDLVCTVRAGTTLAELAGALAPAGLRWPVEAAHPDRATVGGTIASAAPGPSRLRHQHVRDWVIGCEAVLGDGTRARAGGRVVKNVTGFDLARLYSGTYGSLAVITEVSLKLIAVDARTATLQLHGDATALARVGVDLRALPLDAIALVTGDGATLTVRVAGIPAVVDRLVREVRSHGPFVECASTIWAELMARTHDAPDAARLAVPPGRESEDAGGSTVAYLGTGIAYRLDAPARDLRDLRGRCEAAGGALVLERCADADRLALGTWGRPTVPTAIAHALKERFDPHGVLAPGRMPA